jgi:DNA replication protein DnaC
MTTPTKTPTTDELRGRVKALGLWGLLARFDELALQPWVPTLIELEEAERKKRSLERRIANARIGAFKPMADFDWRWPLKIDRELIDELFTLQFLHEAANVVLLGPNGNGKTMIAKNLAYQALLRGATVRFTSASAMLNELTSQDSSSGLQRRLKRYVNPTLLVVDEVGYLSYDNRHADLLFEVVSRRYGHQSIVLTTNKPFSEWTDVFPNAACVVTMIDRLLHKAEIVEIAAESYRLKEAKERAARRQGKAKAKAKTAKRPKRKAAR